MEVKIVDKIFIFGEDELQISDGLIQTEWHLKECGLTFKIPKNGNFAYILIPVGKALIDNISGSFTAGAIFLILIKKPILHPSIIQSPTLINSATRTKHIKLIKY